MDVLQGGQNERPFNKSKWTVLQEVIMDDIQEGLNR